jgi:hypothetical protein
MMSVRLRVLHISGHCLSPPYRNRTMEMLPYHLFTTGEYRQVPDDKLDDDRKEYRRAPIQEIRIFKLAMRKQQSAPEALSSPRRVGGLVLYETPKVVPQQTKVVMVPIVVLRGTRTTQSKSRIFSYLQFLLTKGARTTASRTRSCRGRTSYYSCRHALSWDGRCRCCLSFIGIIFCCICS